MADEFDTDKGIKEDYDGVVKEAYFQAFEDQGVNLVLMNVADDGEEVEQRYRVGTDWASFDGGVTIEHPNKHIIRSNSQLATLVERAFAAGAETQIRERSSANRSLGPRTAQLWPGLRFHWDVEEVPYDFKDRKTGEQVKGTSYKSYPTRFLGEGNAQGDAPGVSTTPSTNDPQPPDEILAKLKVAA